jgi:Trk-type K+ transport system membrane component
MAIGACPAGTGGGLKLTTLAEIGHGARHSLANQPAGRAFGFALAWLGLYGLIAGVSLLLLVCCEPQLSGDRLLFLAVSAASNVGLSHDAVNLTGPGLYVLSGTMLLGRLTPILLLVHMARTGTEADILVA